MNFTKSVRTPVFAEHHQRLLLIIVVSTVVNGELANETANYRSSHQRCSINKGVLRDFKKFTGKHLCQSLFFDKVAGLRLWHRCFIVNFAKCLRKPFLQNTSGRLIPNLSQKFNLSKRAVLVKFEQVSEAVVRR